MTIGNETPSQRFDRIAGRRLELTLEAIAKLDKVNLNRPAEYHADEATRERYILDMLEAIEALAVKWNVSPVSHVRDGDVPVPTSSSPSPVRDEIEPEPVEGDQLVVPVDRLDKMIEHYRGLPTMTVLDTLCACGAVMSERRS